MTFLKALKYKIAKSSKIAKKSKQLKLTFLYNQVLNILNTCQYKPCSYILKHLKFKV